MFQDHCQNYNEAAKTAQTTKINVMDINMPLKFIAFEELKLNFRYLLYYNLDISHKKIRRLKYFQVHNLFGADLNTARQRLDFVEYYVTIHPYLLLLPFDDQYVTNN